MLIGLMGYAGSGKDSAAEFLVANYDFKSIAFADKLREMAYDIDPYLGSGMHLQEAVDKFGWDYTKRNYPECRRFLTKLGTEGIRDHIDQNYWVNTVVSQIRSDPDKNWVITDVRFPNENARTKLYFPEIEFWYVDRPGVTRKINHSSEDYAETMPRDRTILNDGNLNNLHSKIAMIIGESQLV